MQRPPARFRRAAPLRAFQVIVALGVIVLLAACASEPTIASSHSGERPASELTQRPVPRLRVPPGYPFELRKKGLTGKARVEFVVTKYGDVVNAHAISATYPAFGFAAEVAISKSKFSPGLKDGRPVNVLMQQDLFFHLAEAPPKPAQH